MKRVSERLFLLLAAFIFAAAATPAQQTAPAAAPAAQAQAAPAAHADGTGIVPPGVKLVPQMPPVGAPRPFEFPAAATKTLSNGLRVFVVTDHSEPAVAVQLVILSAGTIKDPEGAPGVAQMTANLLTQGTEKRSAQQIAEAIDFVGGSLTAAAGKDTTTVGLDVVKKDLSMGLDLMSDVVLHPAFKSEELDRQRQQLLSNLTVDYSDPDYLASLVFARSVYGDSPYGLPAEGTPETVKRFDRDAFVKFHDANYAPNESLLAFAGDITPEAAFAFAEKYFGAWPRRDVAPEQPAAPAPTQGIHIWLVDKPGAVQTQIRVGKVGIPRADPDYLPLQVTNRIFGGGYNSRLNTEVRLKKGLTYGAYSTFSAHLYTGAFMVGTFTRTEATVEATQLVVNLIGKMASGQLSPQELDFARDYLAGVYPIQSETSEQVAERVLTAAVYGLPADYNRTYPEKIRGVSLAEAESMAQKYFSPDNLDIVLAGNVSAFRDALKKQFPAAHYDEVSFDQINVLEPDLHEPRKSAEAAVTPESLARGKEILAEAAKAAGGDALSSVAAISLTEDGKIFGMGSGMPIHVEWIVSYPDHSRGDVSMGAEKVVQVCDGKSAWLEFPGKTADASPYLAEFERGIALFGGGWGIYRQVLAGKLSGPFIGEEEIDGKKTLGVAVKAPFGDLKLYFDASTHLLAAARYQSQGDRGMRDNEQRWSDYRSVDGRQFAYGTEIYRNGSKFLESMIQEIRVNPAVDPSVFVKPTNAPAH